MLPNSTDIQDALDIHDREVTNAAPAKCPDWVPLYLNQTWATNHPTDPDLATTPAPAPPTIIRDCPAWLPGYIDEDWCLAHPTAPNIAASPPLPPVTIACDHPECLARPLGLPATTDFINTLTIVTAVYTTIGAIISLFPGSSVATILQRVRDSLTTTTCHHIQLLPAAMRIRGEHDWVTLTTGISNVFARLNAHIGTTWTWALDRITTLQDHRCLATAPCTIRRSDLQTYNSKKDFADWATTIRFALADHLLTAVPTCIVTAVFSVLEEAAATWASGRAPEEFEGDTARVTLDIIIFVLDAGFMDPREADAAQKQLAVLGSVGKTWAEYK